jgi:hypothetical protein
MIGGSFRREFPLITLISLFPNGQSFQSIINFLQINNSTNLAVSTIPANSTLPPAPKGVTIALANTTTQPNHTTPTIPQINKSTNQPIQAYPYYPRPLKG